MKVFDDQMTIGNCPCNRMTEREDWTEGTVITKHGIVEVYTEGGEDVRGFTKVSVVHDGILRTRSVYDKRYTQRGLVTLANRYAEEICG